MRGLVVLALLMGGSLAVALAQPVNKKKLMSPNQKSPPQETSVTINGKQLWIVYHAPSVRGRKIFGGADALQPDDTVWRLGADWATVLHTDAALDVRGVTVPPGDYTLFTALDKGKWQLIINKQTGQWGIGGSGDANFKPSDNVGQVPMTMSKPPAPIEQLKISLSHTSGNQGKLEVEWANVIASVPFTVK